MSKELMKPRYLCIADYPDALWSTNDILSELHNERMVLTKGGLIGKPSEYPDIFRPLLWWEFRDEKEMPEYVKMIDFGDSLLFQDIGEIEPGQVIPIPDNINVRLSCFLPATLEEYESFTKK